MACQGMNGLLMTDPWLYAMTDKSLTFCGEFSSTLILKVKIDNLRLFILCPNFFSSLFDL